METFDSENHNNGIDFLVIIDEQHSNQTALADDFRQRFNPVLSIGSRYNATNFNTIKK